jgi:hypothetical protein
MWQNQQYGGKNMVHAAYNHSDISYFLGDPKKSQSISMA